MQASTGAMASRNQPKVVPASVIECATVNAVMAPARGQNDLLKPSSKVRPSGLAVQGS
jgi:hypothetical protein